MVDLVELVVVVVVVVGRKIDYDDEMKNNVMGNKDLLNVDQDLLEMVDNSFFNYNRLIRDRTLEKRSLPNT